MAKAKAKAGASIPNRHIHSRVSYLYQAAIYLKHASENGSLTSREANPSESGHDLERSSMGKSLSQPRYLLTHMRGVSRKAQTRVEPGIKRTICKHCDAILIPGQTSTCFVENASVAEKKPWADVLVYRCDACQTVKRFPVGQTAPRKKADIKSSKTNGASQMDTDSMTLLTDNN